MSNAIANFEAIAAELIATAQTDRAAGFAAKVAQKIRDKGEAWIIANETKLHVYSAPIGQTAMCPVADNWGFYMGEWQMAVA